MLKRFLLVLIALALLSVYTAQANEYPVSSVAEILAAMEQPDCTALVFQDESEGNGGAELVIDRMIAIDRPLRVVANRGFTSVRIVEGGALLLAEGASLGTRSTIDFDRGIFAIGQFWVDGGMLGAKQGVIEPYTTFYVTNGEHMTLPEGEWEGLSVVGGARSESELLACLAEEVYTEVFVQADMTLTQDAGVNRYLRVTDGAKLTIDGCTLTVAGGALMEVYNGSGVDNHGTIVNHGEVHIETEATYTGGLPEGDGAFIRD